MSGTSHFLFKKYLKYFFFRVIIAKLAADTAGRDVSHAGYKDIIVGRKDMAALKLILNIAFVIICIALTILILMQEGKSAGLGAIAGAAETYWGKNKGRSMEGMLVKITRVLVILFILIACVLNIGSF